jgi:hypothetical protein
MTKYYKVSASFQVTASDKDEAFANFEEMVANIQAEGDYLIDHFGVEEMEKLKISCSRCGKMLGNGKIDYKGSKTDFYKNEVFCEDCWVSYAND